MKLNIYNKREIVKTYTADKYELMFGTVEDLVDAINLDAIQTGSDDEIIKAASNLVLTGLDTIKELLKDVFDGLTDEELKRVKVSELIEVIVEIVTYSISQLNFGSGKGKN